MKYKIKNYNNVRHLLHYHWNSLSGLNIIILIGKKKIKKFLIKNLNYYYDIISDNKSDNEYDQKRKNDYLVYLISSN